MSRPEKLYIYYRHTLPDISSPFAEAPFGDETLETPRFHLVSTWLHQVTLYTQSF